MRASAGSAVAVPDEPGSAVPEVGAQVRRDPLELLRESRGAERRSDLASADLLTEIQDDVSRIAEAVVSAGDRLSGSIHEWLDVRLSRWRMSLSRPLVGRVSFLVDIAARKHATREVLAMSGFGRALRQDR